MSDYLNNLVARTLNLATVVQPRLPSLFESSVASSGFALSHELETPSADLSARAPAVPSADLSETQTGQPRMGVTAETVEMSDVPKSRPHFSSSETSAKTKEEVIPRASPVIQATPTATPAAPPHEKVLIRSLARVATVEPNSRTVASREQPPTANVPRPVETPPAQPRRSLTTLTAAKEQPNGPVTSKRMVIGHPAPAAEPPQTISVTIGRVDVRAVFPQPPAGRVSNTQKPAAMSLDEYLKQRSEGRR